MPRNGANLVKRKAEIEQTDRSSEGEDQKRVMFSLAIMFSPENCEGKYAIWLFRAFFSKLLSV